MPQLVGTKCTCGCNRTITEKDVKAADQMIEILVATMKEWKNRQGVSHADVSNHSG